MWERASVSCSVPADKRKFWHLRSSSHYSLTSTAGPAGQLGRQAANNSGWLRFSVKPKRDIEALYFRATPASRTSRGAWPLIGQAIWLLFLIVPREVAQRIHGVAEAFRQLPSYRVTLENESLSVRFMLRPLVVGITFVRHKLFDQNAVANVDDRSSGLTCDFPCALCCTRQCPRDGLHVGVGKV